MAQFKISGGVDGRKCMVAVKLDSDTFDKVVKLATKYRITRQEVMKQMALYSLANMEDSQKAIKADFQETQGNLLDNTDFRQLSN
jgi:predicted transcriptional regulator